MIPSNFAESSSHMSEPPTLAQAGGNDNKKLDLLNDFEILLKIND